MGLFSGRLHYNSATEITLNNYWFFWDRWHLLFFEGRTQRSAPTGDSLLNFIAILLEYRINIGLLLGLCI